jgi:hypothetical protein
MYEEKVIKHMRLKCAGCNKLPKNSRLVLPARPDKYYSSKAKTVFCDIDCAKLWFAIENGDIEIIPMDERYL